MKFTANDIICGDMFLALHSETISYIKTDVFERNSPILWRGNVNIIVPARVWISGHSDYDIDEAKYTRYSPYCSIWYTTNKTHRAPNLIGIPIGITNDCPDSPVHPILGNKIQMLEVMEMPKRNDTLVYMNISVHTHKERDFVYNLFKDKPWVKTENCVYETNARRRFLENIRNSRFVMCPRGNGVDTHRLWETLYLGSIPIVIRHMTFDEFHDLPILWIDDWNEINEDFLLREYDRIANQLWNLEKLKFGYWKRRISEQMM
jgi:hypothetical protein